MKRSPLVSVVIPTKNSGQFLESCFRSIKNQSYKNIEIIVVDGNSKDNTLPLSKKYKVKVFQFDPKLPKGKFDAPHRRNYGVKKAKGVYVYYADADYELSTNFIKQAVEACQKGAAAVINPLDTIGTSIWAKAKNLERRSYFGDDTVECPRFFKKSVWDKLGGLDESLGGGGDDWDLYQKLLENNCPVVRIKSIVKNNEGDLKLIQLYNKGFRYGRDVLRYVKKRPLHAAKSYFPIRPGYIKNWRLFVNRPKDTLVFLVMRFVEYFAGVVGIIYALIKY